MLDISKATQLNEIPTKNVKRNVNFFATFSVKDINTCIKKREISDKLKASEITAAFKKADKHDKSNYRPVSILPILSRVYKIY